MKKMLSFFLASVIMMMTVIVSVPVQAAPYEGYPYVFEDFEKGTSGGFSGNGVQVSYKEGGAGGSEGCMAVKITAERYGDIAYKCPTPPVAGCKLRFSAWIKLLDEIKLDRMSFILYGTVLVPKTDPTVEGPEMKTANAWYQITMKDRGLKVGEWTKITYDAEFTGNMGCNPGAGYAGATEDNQAKNSTEIVSLDRFSIRVGDLGGHVDLVDSEATSLSYEIDDVMYEIAPAETGGIEIGNNLIDNGEFDYNIDGWSVAGAPEIIQDGTAPDGSKGYLKIQNKDGAAATFNLEQKMTWKPNHLYHVTFWAKMDDTKENTTEGGAWLLQLASGRVVDENGMNETYPGVELPKTLTVGGGWVKYDYYYINEYKTYTEQQFRTWLRLFPQTKQHNDNISTFGLDSFQIIDLGPISNGDMEIGGSDKVYQTKTSGKKTQDVLGWNTSKATISQSDDVSEKSNGTKSMKVTVTEDNGYAYQGLYMEKDKKYRITFRAKGENLDGETPFAMVLDRKVPAEGSNDSFVVPDYEYYYGNGVANEYTDDIKETQSWKLTNEWQTYSCVVDNEFPLKSGVTTAPSYVFPRLPFMYFTAGNGEAGMTYYLDDIQIEETSDVLMPKVENVSLEGNLIPGETVRVTYDFVPGYSDVDKSIVRVLIKAENGQYASLGSFSAHESFKLPDSVAGKDVVFEVVPIDGNNYYGAAVMEEITDPGNWINLSYDRKLEKAVMIGSYDIDGALVVAAYKDGKLIATETTTVEADAYQRTYFQTQTIDHREADVIKVMLWDSLDKAKPLCAPEEYDLKNIPPVETNLFLLGDSVCAEYGATNYWQQGWGHCMPDVVIDNLTVYNRGLGGRSSKTYMQQGHWDSVKEAMKPGDYVIINFGLNDIHSSVVTETSDGRGTTIEDYKKYLTQYCEETMALGGTPILMSTIAEMSNSYTILQKRSQAMKEVAEELGVVFLDLNTLMNDALLFDENGVLDTEKRQQSFDKYYLSEVAFKKIEQEYNITVPQSQYNYIANTPDRTHINIYGAELVAGYISELIKNSDSYLKYYMK